MPPGPMDQLPDTRRSLFQISDAAIYLFIRGRAGTKKNDFLAFQQLCMAPDQIGCVQSGYPDRLHLLQERPLVPYR